MITIALIFRAPGLLQQNQLNLLFISKRATCSFNSPNLVEVRHQTHFAKGRLCCEQKEQLCLSEKS